MDRVQNYETHRHQPRLTRITWALALLSLVWFLMPALRDRSLVPGLVLMVLAIIVLGLISRAYTIALQDRIIRLEMHIRCRELLGPERGSTIDRLPKDQVVALRFASDEELPVLIERADKEHLRADDIKRAIKNWRADWART